MRFQEVVCFPLPATISRAYSNADWDRCFCSRMAFFSAVHIDLFEEVAKFRACVGYGSAPEGKVLERKIEEHVGGRWQSRPRHCPCQPRKPMNNIVRARASRLLRRCWQAHNPYTPLAYDEAYCLPPKSPETGHSHTTDPSPYETGVMKSVDPLGGSYLVRP